jgi:hypothetical protein
MSPRCLAATSARTCVVLTHGWSALFLVHFLAVMTARLRCEDMTTSAHKRLWSIHYEKKSVGFTETLMLSIVKFPNIVASATSAASRP